jgi:hypothetical protein
MGINLRPKSIDIGFSSRDTVFAACMLLTVLSACGASLAGYFLQDYSATWQQFGITGLFIPDAVSLRETTGVYVNLRPDIDVTWRPLLGVMFLYQIGVFGGTVSICLVNLLLLVVAAYYFFKVLEQVCDDDLYYLLLVFVFSLISVVANIYIVEAMAFPNKEIPLLAISNAYIYYAVIKKNIFLPSVLCLFAIAFRDGYGLILFGCLFVIWFLRERSPKVRVVTFAFIAIVLALFSIENFAKVSEIVARNVEIGKLSGAETIGYLGRLKYNVLSLGLLNTFITDDGRVYLLNIGFWGLGVFIISGVFWAIKSSLLSANEMETGISTVILISVLCLAYGTFVQPRYLMPLLFFLSLAFVRCYKSALAAVVLSVSGPILLVLNGAFPKVTGHIMSAEWFWL